MGEGLWIRRFHVNSTAGSDWVRIRESARRFGWRVAAQGPGRERMGDTV